MVYGSMGTMLLYNKHINLYSIANTNFYLGLKIIIATFNNQSRHAIHVIAIYKPFTLPLTHFFQCSKTNHAHFSPKLSDYCFKEISM